MKVGAFDKSLSRTLHESFARRQKADYDDMITIAASEESQEIDHARSFYQNVKCFLAEHVEGLNLE